MEMVGITLAAIVAFVGFFVEKPKESLVFKTKYELLAHVKTELIKRSGDPAFNKRVLDPVFDIANANGVDATGDLRCKLLLEQAQELYVLLAEGKAAVEECIKYDTRCEVTKELLEVLKRHRAEMKSEVVSYETRQKRMEADEAAWKKVMTYFDERKKVIA